MKQLKSTVLGFLLITTTIVLTSQIGFAQNDSRMQQDLRISQGILSELLKPESRTHRSFFSDGSDASSTYIPGYGVIFEVSTSNFIVEVADIETIDVRGSEDGEDEVRVTVNGSRNSENATEIELGNSLESQKAAVTSYFLNYANLLGQLKPDERISVIVRSGSGFQFVAPPPPPSRPGQASTVRGWSSASNQSTGFIMSAKGSDIAAHKSGSLSESQFKNRISTTDIKRESSIDLRIFEKILETGLSGDANPTFSLGRGLTSVYDNESGLLVLGNVRGNQNISVVFREVELDSLTEITELSGIDSLLSPRFLIRGNAVTLDRNLDTLKVGLRRANEQLERARVELAKARELQIVDINGGFEFFSENEMKPSRSPEEVKADLESFIDSTKDLLLDYGRTLDQVKSGQNIMLHMNVRASGDEMPDKLIFSVKKETIENYDRRAITKEVAKSQISVVRQ